ncbi:Uncharacterized protein Fot_42327 [Forsythia ovata]|uniref:Uncharacterized protein n=1 Tax=Forsythia ovata TaxID=205694 RepID=A0ABD1RKU8_9LAMI
MGLSSSTWGLPSSRLSPTGIYTIRVSPQGYLPLGYPAAGQPGSSAPLHSGHGSGVGAMLAEGAAATAAAYGASHLAHGAAGQYGRGGHVSHSYGKGHDRGHGKFKQGKFKGRKHGKFGKHNQHYWIVERTHGREFLDFTIYSFHII